MLAQPAPDTSTSATTRPHTGRQPDEPALVARAQQGDEAAFTTLYERLRSPIFNHLYRLTGDPQVAEDLTADTFLKAWLHLPETRPGTLWGPWVYHIATNVFRDRYRHEALLRWQEWGAYVSVFHPSQVAKDVPERDVLDAETRREVREVLDDLADAPDGARPNAIPNRGHLYRLALELHYLGGCSLREIAVATGFNYTKMRSLLHRARDAFREAWVARHGEPEQDGR